MKEYMKMGDKFDLPMKTGKDKTTLLEVDSACIGDFVTDEIASYAAHAINSHDELVDSYQLAVKERNEWEARACKEASRVKDLEDFLYHFLAHSHNVDVGGGDFTATTCEALDMAEKLDNRVYEDMWPGH